MNTFSKHSNTYRYQYRHKVRVLDDRFNITSAKRSFSDRSKWFSWEHAVPELVPPKTHFESQKKRNAQCPRRVKAISRGTNEQLSESLTDSMNDPIIKWEVPWPFIECPFQPQIHSQSRTHLQITCTAVFHPSPLPRSRSCRWSGRTTR